MSSEFPKTDSCIYNGGGRSSGETSSLLSQAKLGKATADAVQGEVEPAMDGDR